MAENSTSQKKTTQDQIKEALEMIKAVERLGVVRAKYSILSPWSRYPLFRY